MTTEKLACPACASRGVTVTEETKWMVNTGAHYCHSVKAHDCDAKVECLDCGWAGERRQLKIAVLGD